ncbi:MAG: hypothetical protein RLN88_03280 [Ekhidna sp.]|uniref:hypothetical protein n=1 Tax=Ekhidna sp. TaxID=2608089 RepID=UPI0032EEA9FE
MTEKRFRFIVRWIFPPITSSLAFGVVFISNASKKLLSGSEFTTELLVAFVVTLIAGTVGGLAYSIYRPQFRKLGRHAGDLLTGAITIDFYFIAIYNILQYNEFDQGLADGIWALMLFATVI